MSEKYIKRTEKGKGKRLKEQKKRIRELISESSIRNSIDNLIVRSLVHVIIEKDKERESTESPENPDDVKFRERFGISQKEAKRWTELDQAFPEGG